MRQSEEIPHAKGAKGAKVKEIPGPKPVGSSFLGDLGGLGVRQSEEIPHAKGAKAAKEGNSGRPKLAGVFLPWRPWRPWREAVGPHATDWEIRQKN